MGAPTKPERLSLVTIGCFMDPLIYSNYLKAFAVEINFHLQIGLGFM